MGNGVLPRKMLLGFDFFMTWTLTIKEEES